MRVYWIRKTHRYMGLFVGLQLLLWTASGLYFSWNDIEKVRGEHLSTEPTAVLTIDSTLVSPHVATASLTRGFSDGDEISSVTLRLLLEEPVYEIKYREAGETRFALADARTGEIRSPLREDVAVALARADFTPEAQVSRVDLITEVTKDSEFRGRDLPAYRVVFDHDTGTRVYVSANRGMVTARRNNTWRVFDFLWMFHIMDYETRDDINNILLKALSILGLTTVLTGYVLWGFTSPLLRRRRRRVAAR